MKNGGKNMKTSNRKATTVRLLFVCLAVFLAVGPARSRAEGVDAKQIVFDHLGDAYGWHVTRWNDRDLRLPLPVILRSETKGWHVFLSSRLEEGRSYRGFRIASDGPYAGKITETDADGREVRPLDLSVTKTAFALMINAAVVLALILIPARWYRRHPGRVPNGFVGAVEMLTMAVVDDIVKPCVGKGYEKFAPYLLTAFYFILVNNVMGIIPVFPGGANTTGNIAVTLLLALCTFVAVNLFGTKAYWKDIFWPDVSLWMKVPLPLMPFLELFGIFTKPFALMMRLFANIMAGHAVILGIVSLIFISAAMGPAMNAGMSFVAVLFNVFMNVLELLVAFIQAYVFTMLSAVFIGLARKQEEKRPAPAASTEKTGMNPANE